MIEIISGTDRPNSNSLKVAQWLLGNYKALKQPAQLLDLCQLNLNDVAGGPYFKGAGGTFRDAVARVNVAEGLVMVVPEYNGSFPGILKLFIDYWRYPDSFEHRPVAFVGLGLRWGGLRPVEHLQQVFGYRNAYVFPSRVFIHNIKEAFKEGEIADPMIADLLKVQARTFIKFIRSLKAEGLDANSLIKAKQ